MGNLIKEWVKGILTEDINKKVVVYAGRFQPFHKGHYATYSHLVKQFGKDNVYIGTSDKTDNIKSPFRFKEKKVIMMKMFGIPSNKIVQIKNPYAPTEIIGKFPEESTAFITVVGEKDRYRLKGKYFEPYHPDRVESGYKDKGYVYVAPAQSNPICGTDVRDCLSKGSEEQRKIGFKKAYGKFDPKIFKLVSDKLFKIESKMERFINSFDIEPLLEASQNSSIGKSLVDDGPGFTYGNSKTYKKVGEDVAQMLGWQVVDYILGSDEDSIYADNERKLDDKYPVSYFPSGIDGLDAQSIRYIELKGNKAYKAWADKIKGVATLVGYKLVDFLDAEESIEDTKDAPTKELSPDDRLTENNSNVIVEVGESTSKIYKYKKSDSGLGSITYKFTTPSKLQYIVQFINSVRDVYISHFITKGGTASDVVNKGEMYSIMSTIADIHKNFIKFYNPGQIKFTAQQNFKGDKRRLKLYMAYLKKNLPSSAQITTKGNSRVIITFNKTLSTEIKDRLTEGVLNEDNVKFYDALAKNANRWYRFKTSTIKQVSDNIIKLIQNAYKNTDDGSFVNTKSDFNYSTYWYAIELDDGDKEADAVIFARKSPNGIKIQGIGHDGDVVSKRELLGYLAKLLIKQGHWIEASGALEKVLYRLKVPYISSEKVAQSIFPNTDLKMIGDAGKYTRKLGNGKEITETIFGRPNVKVSESFINEGGAYGHMNHPFDVEMNLTFGDLKAIIKGALNGNLELAREKTDGQALAISWRDDRGLIAARNKSHLKNRGAEALTIKGVADKFANRGGLTDAYNFAMKDLESAIKGLSKAQRDKIFQQGASFMNLEVIYPTSVNVIPYDQPLLVFHNTTEYNEKGEAIGANQSAARILAGMIKQINKDVQDNYTIQGPPVTELPKSQKLSAQQSKFESKLKKLQSEFKLKDSDGVADYHQAWWDQWVDKNSPETLTNKEKMGLVKRWAFNDKSFRLDKKNIESDKVLQWAKKTDKLDRDKISKENTMKFEEIFLGVGAEVLSFMSSVLAANPDKAVRDMKKELDNTIKAVQKSGDPKKIEKLRLELERLARLGGKEKIVPNEGIVFVYKGNTYKLTGAFAPLNQILGLMYF